MKTTRRLLVTFAAAFLLCSDVVYGWSLADRLSGRVPLRRIQTHRKTSSTSNNQQTTTTTSSTKHHQREMLNFIDQPMETTVGDTEQLQQQQDDDQDLLELVRCIVRAADGRKAEDIVALRVDKVSTLTSVLVILSGNSRPQNQAIATAIQNDIQETYNHNLRPGGSGVPEGTADSGWMLLDYGSVMVHIMTPKSRLYYNVEGQWRDKGGEELDMSDVLIPNKKMVEQQQPAVDAFVAEEDDPFWS